MKCVTFYDHFVLSFRWTLNSQKTLLNSAENFRNIIGMNSHSALNKIKKQINCHNQNIKRCHLRKLRCNTKDKSIIMKGANRCTIPLLFRIVLMTCRPELNSVKVKIQRKDCNAHGGGTWQFLVLYERAYQKEDVPHFYATRKRNLSTEG